MYSWWEALSPPLPLVSSAAVFNSPLSVAAASGRDESGDASVAGSTGMPLAVVLMLGPPAALLLLTPPPDGAGIRTSRGSYGQFSESDVVNGIKKLSKLMCWPDWSDIRRSRSRGLSIWSAWTC